MFTKRQMEIMKVLLFNWGEDDNVISLSFDVEKLTELSNCLNQLLSSSDLLTENDMFNRISFAKSAMSACPTIFAHFNPNQNSLNLSFDDEETSILLSHLKTDISNMIEQIQEIGKVLVEQNDECFLKKDKIKKI